MAQRMKIMQYFLPIMLLFVFNNFASGLSLYYLIFNVLSIFQQLSIKARMMRRSPKSIDQLSLKTLSTDTIRRMQNLFGILS